MGFDLHIECQPAEGEANCEAAHAVAHGIAHYD
jgi:hypothetical protein